MRAYKERNCTLEASTLAESATDYLARTWWPYLSQPAPPSSLRHAHCIDGRCNARTRCQASAMLQTSLCVSKLEEMLPSRCAVDQRIQHGRALATKYPSSSPQVSRRTPGPLPLAHLVVATKDIETLHQAFGNLVSMLDDDQRACCAPSTL